MEKNYLIISREEAIERLKKLEYPLPAVKVHISNLINLLSKLTVVDKVCFHKYGSDISSVHIDDKTVRVFFPISEPLWREFISYD